MAYVIPNVDSSVTEYGKSMAGEENVQASHYQQDLPVLLDK
jgi:hypothetical protein